jgi:hypothetical protein
MRPIMHGPQRIACGLRELPDLLSSVGQPQKRDPAKGDPTVSFNHLHQCLIRRIQNPSARILQFWICSFPSPKQERSMPGHRP